MYPQSFRHLYRHWLARFGFFVLGVLLLYAPFAFLPKIILALANSPYDADVHRICLRMPIQWMAQPWMYQTILQTPVYWAAVFVLPLFALFLGPLFCGWLCPAGQLTEILSRVIPPRFQIKLSTKINPAPVRYGFTAGIMAVSFIGGNACCSFCNFTHTQTIISAVFGNFAGLGYWASFTILSFFLWFVVLGLFTQGGRGWCNFLCPSGALMGLTHSIGSRLKIGRSVKIDQALCHNCKACSSICPAWAISTQDNKSQINTHSCTVCMDCVKVCPEKAITYGSHKPEQSKGKI
jgi:ferredoxin-type protein NapH